MEWFRRLEEVFFVDPFSYLENPIGAVNALPHVYQVNDSKSRGNGTLSQRIIVPFAGRVEAHLGINGKRLPWIIEILQLHGDGLVWVILRQLHVHWLVSRWEAHVDPHLGVTLSL